MASRASKSRIGAMVLLALGGVQLGCAGVLEPLGLGDLMSLGSPVVLERELVEAEVGEALALADRAAEGQFPRDDVRSCEELAPHFTWLGAYAEDPGVVEAALWAMDECIDHVEVADALAVAGYRLGSEHIEHVVPAMWIGRATIQEAPSDHEVVHRLVTLAIEHPDMGVRIEALEALDGRSWIQEPHVADAFYEALMAEWKPPLTATALDRLRYRSAGMLPKERARFLPTLMVLAGDLDPGIRGYSALALARLAPEEEEVKARILGLLRDKHGFTRSAAAAALADMRYLPAVHDLVAGLDDEEPNRWKMLPFQRPDGNMDRLRFDGSRFARVDDAFLRALEDITSVLEKPFRYRKVNLRYRDLDIAAAVRDAREWYAKHEASIPRRGDQMPVEEAAPPVPEAEEEGS